MSVSTVDTRVGPNVASFPVPPTGLSNSVLAAVAASRPWRVLVTGSRDWTDMFTVWDALDAQAGWAELAGYRLLTIVHGDCPTGADSLAQDWALFPHALRDLTVLNEPHPADWDKYKLSAGPRRNKLMVELGADVCLAFIRNGSRGATHCSETAVKSGIPTEVKRA